MTWQPAVVWGGSVGGYCHWCFVLGDCGRFAEVGQAEVTVRVMVSKEAVCISHNAKSTRSHDDFRL